MRRRHSLWIGAVIAGGVCGGCVPFPGQSTTPIRASDEIAAEFVIAGAAKPSSLAFDTAGRVFYAERETGRIRVIVDGVLQDAPFAEVPVNFAGERGLLAVALHPRFVDNGRVYAAYVRSDTGASTNDPRAVVDLRIVYFEAVGDTAAGGEVFVTSIPVIGTARLGGRIAFSADRRLIIALGDQGDGGAAQDAGQLLGKVLRLQDDGTIPADNPIAGSSIFARGVRDPRGLALDTRGAALWLLDRGPSGEAELNILSAGANFGAPLVVGRADTAAEITFRDENADYVDPVSDTSPERPLYAGAGFNPSSRYTAANEAALFVAESANGRVVALPLDTARTAIRQGGAFAGGLPTAINDLAFTPAGTLYVATDTAVLRFAPVR